jgi:hypothetical protein
MPLVLNGTTGVQDNSGAFVAGTAVASTSGTSIDFTGIPSWVKRVTVVGTQVSTNGASSFLIQLGDSGGVETSGYESGMFGNVNQTNTSSAGVVLLQSANSGADNYSFSIVFNLESVNKWVATGTTVRNGGAVFFVCSFKSLSATLDRVRITTVNGTDAFDAGSINILYE